MSIKLMKKILLFTIMLGFSYNANSMNLFDKKTSEEQVQNSKLDKATEKIEKKIEENKPAEDLKKHNISFEVVEAKRDPKGELKFKLNINVAEGWKLYAHDNLGPTYTTGRPLKITVQTLPDRSFVYNINNIESEEIIVKTEVETEQKTSSGEIENKARIYKNKTQIPVMLESAQLNDDKVMLKIDYTMCDNKGHCNVGQKDLLIDLNKINKN